MLRQRGENEALQAVALMTAKAGVEHKLPSANSIVYATAQSVDGAV